MWKRKGDQIVCPFEQLRRGLRKIDDQNKLWFKGVDLGYPKISPSFNFF
jgi:hypothetical protein